jgi:hypothetical protein
MQTRSMSRSVNLPRVETGQPSLVPSTPRRVTRSKGLPVLRGTPRLNPRAHGPDLGQSPGTRPYYLGHPEHGPPSHAGPPSVTLPPLKGQVKMQRDIIRLQPQQGWSVERLAEHYFYYAVEVVKRIISQPLETEQGRVLKLGVGAAQAGKPRRGRGCGVSVRATQQWVSPGCKKRALRGSQTPV